jgi:hypothetical protein
MGNSAQVVILVYERVAEMEEGTAIVAFDVLSVFVGHVELCVIVQSNFVVWLAQVMQRLRNPRLMCQQIGVHFNDANLLCDPCFNITLKPTCVPKSIVHASHCHGFGLVLV